MNKELIVEVPWVEVMSNKESYNGTYDELLIHKRYKYRKKGRPMTKPKVFVVNRGMHDYSAAEKFGDIVYLSDELQVKTSAPAILRQFTDILVEESSPSDYLLATGLAFLNEIATAVFCLLHGRVNALIFNKASNNYNPLLISMPPHILQRSLDNVKKRGMVTPV